MEKDKTTLIVRYIFLVLSLGLMCLIFWFSSQDKEASGTMSGEVGSIIADILEPILPKETTETIQTYIRQIAHFFLYACLGLSVSIFIFTFSFPRGHGWAFWALPLLICLAYACSDEIHQLFISGRSGSIFDVGIDALGFVLTTVICNFFRILSDWCKERARAKKRKGGA